MRNTIPLKGASSIYNEKLLYCVCTRVCVYVVDFLYGRRDVQLLSVMSSSTAVKSELQDSKRILGAVQGSSRENGTLGEGQNNFSVW